VSPGAASAGHSDDCASLREALTKRFGGVNGSDGTVGTSGGQEEWPGLVLIDGGKGQLNAVLPPPPLVPNGHAASLTPY
jgi:excinuclease UvrABC nuclease subunit